MLMNEMTEYNPLLAPDAKEKLMNILENMTRDFNVRLQREATSVVEGLVLANIISKNKGLDSVKYAKPVATEEDGLIKIELRLEDFQPEMFVDEYINNEAPSTSVTIQFFEGGENMKDGKVTVNLDGQYWDEDELELCAIRLTASYEGTDSFNIDLDNLNVTETAISTKLTEAQTKLYSMFDVIYDIDVYQMTITLHMQLNTTYK